MPNPIIARRVLLGAPVVVAAAAPFALDSNAAAVKTANTGSGNTLSLTNFATDYAGIVYVAVVANTGTPNTPTATGLTFASRGSKTNGASTVALFYAMSAAPLSPVTITATQTATDFMTATAFAFSGGKQSSQFDTNASIPKAELNAATAFTTDNANDI